MIILQEKFHPHILHKTAVFFNPRQKSMRVLTQNDQTEVLDYVNDHLEELPLRLPETSESLEPELKRRKIAVDEFDDVPDEVNNTEIHSYQRLPVQPDSCTNVLSWWKQHSREFPTLSAVARIVLCTMPTSAPSERSFSLAGHIVPERRSRLSGSSVNDILLIHSELK